MHVLGRRPLPLVFMDMTSRRWNWSPGISLHIPGPLLPGSRSCPSGLPGDPLRSVVTVNGGGRPASLRRQWQRASAGITCAYYAPSQRAQCPSHWPGHSACERNTTRSYQLSVLALARFMRAICGVLMVRATMALARKSAGMVSHNPSVSRRQHMEGSASP